MTIKEKQEKLVEEFSLFEDWEDKYKLIIEKAKEAEPFPEEERTEKNKIDGCQSQVWFTAKFEDGKVKLWADSDAVLVKGMTAMLVYVYSGHTPDEILSSPPEFLNKIGITEHLSPTRKNGLNAMLKQIQLYALAFKALGNKKKD
jgi:cysteine desulfuration protein SufE